MGIQNKIDNRLNGSEAHEAIAVFEHDKKRFFNHARKWKTDFFRRCARNDRYRKNDFSVSAAGFLRAESRIRPTSRPIPAKS